METFVGRRRELSVLSARLERVAHGHGVAVTIRGRRQVGKSRLVQEFCDHATVPYLYFTATKGASGQEELRGFYRELRESAFGTNNPTLPDYAPTTWPDMWRLLSTTLPSDPSIIVLDEVPWLAASDPVFDGALQTGWDRLLSSHPVLLLLLGSDLHMMERLTAYDQPFYGRSDNLILGPLHAAETATVLQLSAAEAIDAQLITGGLPGILRSWPAELSPVDFLRDQCADPAAPVFGVPETTLLAEFPQPGLASKTVEAIGGEQRTHAGIATRVGNSTSTSATTLPSGSLSPILRMLEVEKHLVDIEQPLSTKPGKPALYRVRDTNLQLYLAMLRQAHDLSRRGRVNEAFAVVERRWSSWRGRAVEPLIRDSLELAAAQNRIPWTETTRVGGWWNRQFDPEIDLVGADQAPVAQHLWFVGSVKWHHAPADSHDIRALHHGAAMIPGMSTSTGYVMATLAEPPTEHANGIDLWWSPEDILETYRD